MINIPDILERDEGYRQFVYKDSQGIETIGIGRNLKSRGVTHAEALYLLENDITDYTEQLQNRLYWFDSIHEDAQAVLIMIAFNCGLSGLLTFTKALEHVKNEDYKLAADEFLNSKWANQVGERAIRLTEILKNI